MPDFIPYTRHQLDHALSLLQQAIYTIIAPLEIRAWRTREPVPYSRRTEGEELVLKVGDRWGELFDCAWFRFRGQVPGQAAGMPVVLLLDVSGEMCVFDEHGVPVRGLTNVASDYDYSLGRPGKHVLPLLTCAQGDEPVEVWADAGCNDLFGRVRNNGAIQEAFIAVCHEETRRLFYDYEVLLDSLKALPEKSARHQQILVGLNDAVHLLWSGMSPEAVKAARQRLAPLLAQRGGDPSLRVSAVGHAHMDLGWLWPIRETHRKGARTFSTALANMELYPDYVFAASQAQYFAWIKEDHPELYARIQQKVKEGRIEPQGALWVECDTNLTGGESLVRQILYGRRYFQADFDVDPLYIWLPDAFGYSGALPQIMKKAGLKYFSTQKLSWSLINRFPHQSFHWQGIDGSQVLVHMLPEETYNSPAAPRSLGRIEENYNNKGVSSCALMVFGIGDGGGGPGEEHLERLARIHNFAGLPPVKQEWTASFLDQWAGESANFKAWVGELYLERHEGTLTTSARSKWYNRRMEQTLRELEWTAAMATQMGAEYPAQRLEAIWKEVLLYQFHDILPGSSIKRVYDESLARYRLLLDEVEDLLGRAQSALAGGPGNQVAVFNSLNWARSEWVRLESGWRMLDAPSMGWKVIDATTYRSQEPTAVTAAVDCLENDRLCARFDVSGAVCSLVDKQTGREIIPDGESANQLLVFTDHGDAWDFPMDYAQSAPQRMMLVSSAARVDGPCAVLNQNYQLGHSTLTQEIRLTAGSARLEFTSQLDWREPRTMLRAFFPVAVRADQAAYEVQFGHLYRPTHTNTTWDLGRDEVCGHKWVDLSERGYGVALLNDSKYGHRIKGHTIELDLLRSVPYPGTRVVKDEDVPPGEHHGAYTDQAAHRFRYALYPHQGDLVDGQVARQAYEFNLPLRLASAAGSGEHSFLQVDADNVIVETVKRAEDGPEWILRLYEAAGMDVTADLKFGFPVQHVEEVDLMERPLRALETAVGVVRVHLRPFEILSIKVG